MLREVLLVCIGIWVVRPTNAESNDYSVCGAEECQTLAKYILSGMNKSVDPCDDFHGYVCGSWSTNYPIPADWYAWSLGEMTRQKIRMFLK
ncbi:neprilysin-11-like, partial [Belonocnema kinseyi]|uniref:neprilysin-11-like n=1 Tax=Belonocnema kinseyi TaxID=2817044 RepID=UPI00143D9753